MPLIDFTISRLTQQFVTGGVTARVVDYLELIEDYLELIEVQVTQRVFVLILTRTLQYPLQQPLELAPIYEARQVIVTGLMRQLLRQEVRLKDVLADHQHAGVAGQAGHRTRAVPHA